MKPRFLLHISLFFAIFVSGQEKAPGPISLEQVKRFISNPLIANGPAQTIDVIKLNGLGFELHENTLAQILDASNKGKRTSMETAKLVLQVMESCTDCRARYFNQWTKSDLMLILANNTLTPALLLEEAKLRGVNGISKTKASREELASKGAKLELIDLLIPLDEIIFPAPEGYKQEDLIRAGYDRKLTRGSATLIAEVNGQMEFLFQHNALFTKPGPDKKTPGSGNVRSSTFNAPMPNGSTQAEVRLFTVWPKPVKGKKKNPDLPKLEVLTVDGGFKFILNNSDKESHLYELRIEYGVPSAPQMK